MKKKCDQCDRPATHHSVEIIEGDKIEKHLCEQHAQQEGMLIKAAHTPINELLTNFVKLQCGSQDLLEVTCETCGMTFADFRADSLLGCPNCYKVFEQLLEPLLERAHEGATHHVGKIPSRATAGDQRQNQMLRMRRQLDEAVTNENYELAARLRDDINRLETGA